MTNFTLSIIHSMCYIWSMRVKLPGIYSVLIIEWWCYVVTDITVWFNAIIAIQLQNVMLYMLWRGGDTTLKRKCHHFDESFITGCTESCHFDNFRCSQWWRFHQNEDIFVSVYVLLPFQVYQQKTDIPIEICDVAGHYNYVHALSKLEIHVFNNLKPV